MGTSPGLSSSTPTGGVAAPTGSSLTCRNWPQEAAFRMLQNNLDPDVAERPDDLVVYGGTGRAARSWDAYHSMIDSLTTLADDETMLVQSGKPVGVLRTHEWAPRVLIANSNLVPEWGTWDEFRRLEHLGLTMYGQMTAGSWIYIGTQGILQGTYECFAAIARKRFGGSLAGTLTVTAGLGGMGGAQPLAITMNDGVALCIEVDPERAERRVQTRCLDGLTDDYTQALRKCEQAVAERVPLSVGLVGNAADLLPRLLADEVAADIVTDQTSAHDPLSYIPNDLAPEAVEEMRRNQPEEFIRRSRGAMAAHVEAMVGFLDAGAEVFDYGNSLRAEAALGGCGRAFAYPGFLPAYIRPLFCEGKGPFRWVALSGDPADIAATDRAVLAEFPEDEGLARWIKLAGERVRATFAEMALGGIGVVGEFHYVHHQPCGSPYADPNAMGIAVANAAKDAGIRLTLLDTLYLHGGLDPAAAGGYVPIASEQARFSDRDVAKWAMRVDDLAGTVSNSTCKVGAAAHSVRAVDPGSIATAAAWARQNGAPLHVHASEQPAENQQCLAVHECTPIELFARTAGLGPEVTLIHATHTSDQDISLMGEAEANCCSCPTTERDLADGVGPAAVLADAGIELCLGSDSNAVIDLFEETRAVELDQRTSTLKRGVFAADALATMATANGYRALGWSEAGTLEVGSLADFTTVSLDSVRLAGTGADNALASVIYAASSADVRHLVVGGHPVVEDGSHTSIDVEAELAAAIAQVTTP